MPADDVGGSGSGGALAPADARATGARASAAGDDTLLGADTLVAADPGAATDAWPGDGAAEGADRVDAAGGETGTAMRDTVGVNGAPTRIRRTGRSAKEADRTPAAPAGPAAGGVDVMFDRPVSPASDRATRGAPEPVAAVAGSDDT
ncbi:MAG: hypothetical protein ACYDAN_10580 [Candidatus Limnocylindrales bacterium]